VGGFRDESIEVFLGARSSPTEIRGEERRRAGKNLTAKRIVSEGGKEIADWMNNQMENRKSEQAQQVSEAGAARRDDSGSPICQFFKKRQRKETVPPEEKCAQGGCRSSSGLPVSARTHNDLGKFKETTKAMGSLLCHEGVSVDLARWWTVLVAARREVS
jgi:hypothetical protein